MTTIDSCLKNTSDLEGITHSFRVFNKGGLRKVCIVANQELWEEIVIPHGHPLTKIERKKMGIRGLETYLKQNLQAAYPVNIRLLIREFINDFKCTPVIVVDGTSVMRHLYNLGNLSWLTGGQMKEFEGNIKEFISAFQKEKAELVFFFDGPYIDAKKVIKLERRKNKMKKIYQVFNAISKKKTFQNAERIVFYFPDNTEFMLKYVAKQCNCKVFNSTKECDIEIAEYALHNNCMAVLSQDTDFIIFQSAKYYLSIKNFKIDDLSTLNYDREGLASSLEISSNHLPLLATLLGNDFIVTERLRKFHEKIMGRKKRYEFCDLIKNLSKIIRKIPVENKISIDSLKMLAENVFGDENKYTDLQDSILSYVPTAAKNRSPAPSGDNWSKIEEKVFDFHKQDFISSTVYSIIVERKYSCGVCLEDYREHDLPSSQNMLESLKKKLYSILLYEFPGKCEVQEWVVCKPQNLDEIKVVEVLQEKFINHPGLLSLWNFEGKKSVKQQLSLICEIFTVDSSELEALPRSLIIPALSLRYLFEALPLEKNEVHSLVSSTVLIKSYCNSNSKIQLNNTSTSTRPFRLYALLTKTYSLVIEIFNAVGNPVPLDKIKPSNYQDGNLFYLKYIQATQENYTEARLCNNNKSSLHRYEQLMSFVMKNIKPL